MIRDLDGVYFRIERDGKFQSICFSDLTNEEMHKVLENKSNEWLRSMCIYLGEALKDIGETFNIVREQVNQMTKYEWDNDWEEDEDDDDEWDDQRRSN